MRILIVSPLFPPDVAAPASYIKTLATHLSVTHEVTLLVYGHVPEAVTHTRIRVVEKNWPAWLRLTVMTLKLLITGGRHDVILIENGLSAELPGLIASSIWQHKIWLQMSDQKVTYSGWRERVHTRLAKRVRFVLDNTSAPQPSVRPEILPFVPPPTEALANYESEWNAHMTQVHKIIAL